MQPKSMRLPEVTRRSRSRTSILPSVLR